MCPHSDRAANQEMSFATFVMTNIIPQAPNVNRKAWAQLEDLRPRAGPRSSDRLYIIAGPAGQGGVGSNGPQRASPAARWPCRPSAGRSSSSCPRTGGDDDLAKIDAGTRVIAVDHAQRRRRGRRGVGRVPHQPRRDRAADGLHFFDRLPPDVAAGAAAEGGRRADRAAAADDPRQRLRRERDMPQAPQVPQPPLNDLQALRDASKGLRPQRERQPLRRLPLAGER